MYLKLVRPTHEYADQVMQYKEDMLANNDSFDGCAGLEEVNSFSEWIDFEKRLKRKYGVGYVPSERRKGYAGEMLKLMLSICREYGERRILLTCDKTNDASRQTIVKNGGKLENEVKDEVGLSECGIIQRYWITLQLPVFGGL